MDPIESSELNPVRSHRDQSLSTPPMVRPRPSCTFEIRATDDETAVLYGPRGEAFPVGTSLPFGSGTISVEEGQLARICFGKSESALIETENGPIEIGKDRPTKAVDRLIYRDDAGQTIWNFPITSPGILCVSENGECFDNRLLLEAGAEPNHERAALIALGLEPSHIERAKPKSSALFSETRGKAELGFFGEVHSKVISDGQLKRVQSSSDKERGVTTYEVTVSDAGYAALLHRHITRQICRVVDTPVGKMFSLGGQYDDARWPNTKRTVQDLVLFGDTSLEDVLPKLFEKVYGPGATPYLPKAFRSLDDAREYVAKNFLVEPHPERGDLFLISFRDSQSLRTRYTVVSPDELSEGSRMLLRAFGAKPTKAPRQGHGPKVRAEGDKIIFSISPRGGRDVQHPEVVHRLFEAFGPALFEPNFSARTGEYLAARTDPSAAASYLFSRFQFRLFDCDGETMLRWKESGRETFHALEGSLRAEGEPFNSHADLGQIGSALTAASKVDELKTALIQRCDTPITLEATYPRIHGVERGDDGWYAVTDPLREISERICGLDDVAMFKLTSPEFRSALTRLDGTSQPGGLVWEQKEREGLFAGVKMGWCHSALTDNRASHLFGEVLKRGAPVWVDGENAMLTIKPGESREAFWIIDSVHFGAKESYTNYSVAGVTIRRDADGRLSFAPPTSSLRFECGRDGAEAGEAVCVQGA